MSNPATKCTCRPKSAFASGKTAIVFLNYAGLERNYTSTLTVRFRKTNLGKMRPCWTSSLHVQPDACNREQRGRNDAHNRARNMPHRSCPSKTAEIYEFKKWSGRQDSNLRPSGPKPDALPGCATPRQGSLVQQCTSHWLATQSPERTKAGGPGGTRTPDLAVMSGQL
jgi:hypothetical protein